MRRTSKSVVFVRKGDRKSIFNAIYLREAVFRKAISPADIKAGLLPRRAG